MILSLNLISVLSAFGEWIAKVNSVIDLKTMLEFFAVSFLLFYPVLFVIGLYLTSHPDKLYKLDRKLGGAISGVPAGEAPAEKQKKQEEKPASEPIPNENEKQEEPAKSEAAPEEKPDPDKGLSVIRLVVGDCYRCVLTDTERENFARGQFRTWESQNPFVAEIDTNTGVLNAKKEGRAVIEFNQKEVYAIYVKNAISDWFAKTDWEILLEEGFADIACGNKINENWAIVSENVSNATSFQSYVDPRAFRRCVTVKELVPQKNTYGWTPDGKLRVVIYEIEADVNPSEELGMIMERVRTRSRSGVDFWYHMGVNPRTNEYSVDFVAAVIRKDGKTLIVFSTTWRDGMIYEEFLNNMDNILRNSEDLLPEWVAVSRLGKNIIQDSPAVTETEDETEEEDTKEEKEEGADSENAEEREESETASDENEEEEASDENSAEAVDESEIPQIDGQEEEEEEEEEHSATTEEDILNDYPDIEYDGREE